MQITDRVPSKEGVQFVCVWEYGRNIWSSTYRVIENEKYEIHVAEPDDIWTEDFLSLPWENSFIKNVRFIILDRDNVNFINM